MVASLSRITIHWYPLLKARGTRRQKKLSTDPITLAEIFTSAGYETVGVSNNTWISSEFGFDRGFDLFHKSWQYVQTDTDLGEIARMEMRTDKVLADIHRLMDGHPFANVTNAIYGKFLRKKNDYGEKATNDWLEGWLSRTLRH